MMTDDLLVDLEQADAAGRRQILRELPATHDPVTLGVIARWLADPSPAVCEAAVEALTRCGGRDAAAAAALRLRSDDPAQRGYAVDALVRIGSAAIPTMATLLADPDHDVRKYAAEGLASIGDRTALAALVVLLQDEDVTVAAAAAEAIGLLRLRDGIPALARAAREGVDWLRAAAVYSLGEIGGRVSLAHICAVPSTAPFPVLAMAVEAAGRAAAAEPARAVAFLAELVSRDEPPLTELVIGVLGAVLDLQPAPSMPEPTGQTIAQAARLGLRAHDPQVRAASARCLGAVPEACSPDDVALLRGLLASDGQVDVRLAALRTLAATGAVTSSLLAELAATENTVTEVRVAALRLLASHADLTSPDVTALLARVVTAAERPLIRAAALRALLQGESTAGLRLGLDVLDDEGVRDDEPAVAELSACTVEARLALVRQALDEASSGTRRWAFTSLLPAGKADEVRAAEAGPDLLAHAARDDDWSVRAHAVRLLNGEPSPWARQLSRDGCADADGRVRVRAVEALASVPGEVGDVVLLRTCLTDTSQWVRVAALAGLTALGKIDGLVLEPAMRDSFPPLRRAALLAALQVVDDPGTSLREQIRQAAHESLRDDDPEVAQLGRELTRRLE